MILEPLLHSLCLLMTEVLGILHSRGDAVLEGGQVAVLEVQLSHCLIREKPGNDPYLKSQKSIDCNCCNLCLPVKMCHNWQ